MQETTRDTDSIHEVERFSWSQEMATHSSILAWKFPWTEEPGGLQFMGLQKESDTLEQLNTHFYDLEFPYEK